MELLRSTQALLAQAFDRRAIAPFAARMPIHSGAGSICARRTIAHSYRESQANFFHIPSAFVGRIELINLAEL